MYFIYGSVYGCLSPHCISARVLPMALTGAGCNVRAQPRKHHPITTMTACGRDDTSPAAIPTAITCRHSLNVCHTATIHAVMRAAATNNRTVCIYYIVAVYCCSATLPHYTATPACTRAFISSRRRLGGHSYPRTSPLPLQLPTYLMAPRSVLHL